MGGTLGLAAACVLAGGGVAAADALDAGVSADPHPGSASPSADPFGSSPNVDGPAPTLAGSVEQTSSGTSATNGAASGPAGSATDEAREQPAGGGDKERLGDARKRLAQTVAGAAREQGSTSALVAPRATPGDGLRPSDPVVAAAGALLALVLASATLQLLARRLRHEAQPR